MLPAFESVLAFTVAAAILTITPGLDTALVLRTSAFEGARRAFLTGLGIALGCFAWGVVVAAGLGVLLAASSLAYELLKWTGAAYLVYLGIQLLRSPRAGFDPAPTDPVTMSGSSWFLRGLLTNVLNPKVGVFYVSFLPQFIPSSADVVATTIALTAIHAILGITWFTILILATRSIAHLLRAGSFVRWLDRITGVIFVGFGIRLALSHAR